MIKRKGKQYNHKVRYLVNLKQTGFQFLARILSSGSGFVASILIAYYLGFSQFGEFTKLLTVVGIFYIFIDFGLNTVFLQLDREEKYSQLFFLRLFSAAILFIVFAFVTKLPLFSEEIRSSSWILGLTLFPYAIQLSIFPYIQKRLRFDQVSLASGTGATITLISIYYVWQQNLGIAYIFGSYFIGVLASAAIGLSFVKVSRFQLSIDARFIGEMVKKSLPIGLMLFCNLLYFRLDVLILATLKPASDVGTYGFAYKFFEFFIAVPLFLSNTIFPALLSRKRQMGRVHLERSYVILFLLSSICILLVGWFVPYFFTLIKPEFISAGLPFRLLILSLPLFFLSSLLQWILIAEQDLWMLAGIYIAVGIINIILNFAFIPVGSYVAAAIITGISELIVLMLLFIRYKTLQKNNNI